MGLREGGPLQNGLAQVAPLRRDERGPARCATWWGELLQVGDALQPLTALDPRKARPVGMN